MDAGPCPHNYLFDKRCTACGTRISFDKLAEYVQQGPESKKLMMKRSLIPKLVVDEKPCLFLDLDHTCVNTLSMSKLRAVAVPRIFTVLTPDDVRRGASCDRPDVINLTLLDGMPYLVKIRTGVIQAIRALAEHFSIGIFTKGGSLYAKKIQEILDPQNKLIRLGAYTNSDCGVTGPKDIRDKVGICESRSLIWDDTTKVWAGHAQVLKCEGWIWDGYRSLKVVLRGDKQLSLVPVPQALYIVTSPNPPLPPSELLGQQKFYRCVGRPAIRNWMYDAQLKAMVDLFTRVAQRLKGNPEATTANLLLDERKRVFAGLQFAYDEDYMEEIESKYSAEFERWAYELTQYIVAFGGRVMDAINEKTIVICKDGGKAQKYTAAGKQAALASDVFIAALTHGPGEPFKK